MVYFASVPLRNLIPTVSVRLETDEGEVAFRARWKASPLDLQRLILFKIRRGRPIWFQDDRGHDLCFRPEAVRSAVIDGRPVPSRP
jgi:hypothetical protein